MKIIRFLTPQSSTPLFGVVVADYAVSFTSLQALSGNSASYLANSNRYLECLPESEKTAKSLLDWGLRHIDEIDDKSPLYSVQLLEPVEVAALYDFALTPRHLKNAFTTMLSYEKNNPDILAVMQAIGKSIVSKEPSEADIKMGALSHYKSSMNSIVGENTDVPWPLYTSRLDIEPELAAIYGNEKQLVAGYCIFNDISARDIQPIDLVCGMGLCRSKDLEAGNQLGPYLVTLDEVGDPYNLKVIVKVDGEKTCEGSTAEISHKAESVFSYLSTYSKIKPGTVVGFGTVSDTTALDHDGPWIDPGSRIEISIEKLGTSRCKFNLPTEKLYSSRWPLRTEMEKFHK